MSSCLAFMSAFISMATWRGSTESRRRSCEKAKGKVSSTDTYSMNTLRHVWLSEGRQRGQHVKNAVQTMGLNLFSLFKEEKNKKHSHSRYVGLLWLNDWTGSRSNPALNTPFFRQHQFELCTDESIEPIIIFTVCTIHLGDWAPSVKKKMKTNKIQCAYEHKERSQLWFPRCIWLTSNYQA